MRNTIRFLTVACALLANSAFAQNQGLTVPPGGGGGGSGTVTSIATACGVTGGTITTTGTIQGAITANAQTGTSYTPLATDCGKLVTISNASAIAITLTNANFSAGNFFEARVLPASVGAATFTPSSGTIDAGATLVLQPGQGTVLIFDGTNWQTMGQYATGPASSTTGNFPSFVGTGGQRLQDSGVAAANVATGAASSTASNFVLFADGAGKALSDSGVVSTYSSLDVHPGYVSGLSYLPLPRRAGVTGAVGTTQTVYCAMAFVAQSLTTSKLGVYIPTTAGSSNFNLGIYSSVSGRPGTLLSSTGNFANNATGSLTGNITQALKKGTPYWFCQMTGDATAVMNGNATTSGFNADIGVAAGSESVLLGNAANITGISCSAACNGGTPVSLAFPANLAGSTWTNLTNTRSPAIFFTIASIP